MREIGHGLEDGRVLVGCHHDRLRFGDTTHYIGIEKVVLLPLSHDVLGAVFALFDHFPPDSLEELSGGLVGSGVGQEGVEATHDAESIVLPVAGRKLSEGLKDYREADAVTSNGVRHGHEARDVGMPELVIEHIDGEFVSRRHPTHAGVEDGTEEGTRPKAIVFGVLCRDDEIDDGLLLADALEVERALGRQLHQVLIGECPKGREGG